MEENVIMSSLFYAKGNSSFRTLHFVCGGCQVADWLSDECGPATYLNMDESHRPVKLRKVVLGFPCNSNQSDFKFDLSLNYKMANIIQTYSDQKPALVVSVEEKNLTSVLT